MPLDFSSGINPKTGQPYTEAELRGQPETPGVILNPDTPMAPPPTYANGHVFAGTGGQPMSDAAYELVSNHGQNPIATDRDVLGGGNYGFRGWANKHPLGMIAATIAAAAGSAALAGGAGAGGAGAGAGAGAGTGAGTGAATGGAATGAATGGAAAATGGAGAAAGALPEIVVTGTVPAGITAGQAAALGAGAGGLGSALHSGYSGGSTSSGNPPQDYGEHGGLQQAPNDLVSNVRNTQLGQAETPNITGGAGKTMGVSSSSSGVGSQSTWQKFAMNLGKSLQQGSDNDQHITELAKMAPPPVISLGQNLTAEQYAELLKRAEDTPPGSGKTPQAAGLQF